MAIGGVFLGASCHRTIANTVTQPNPLIEPAETLRESEEITIITGDMELNVPKNAGAAGGSIQVNQRYPLANRARFTVVSRDRLRFHVQIEHKWKEYADITTWKATIVDDTGHRYEPEDIDLISDRHIVTMWDYETRSVARNRFGDITHVFNDGHKRRQTLGSMSLFRGRGDFVFYARDIFTKKIRALTLRLERDGMTFVFTWKFTDAEISAPAMAARH